MCEGGGMRGCVCVSAPGEIVSMQLSVCMRGCVRECVREGV